jgi:hypothetical protein
MQHLHTSPSRLQHYLGGATHSVQTAAEETECGPEATPAGADSTAAAPGLTLSDLPIEVIESICRWLKLEDRWGGGCDGHCSLGCGCTQPAIPFAQQAGVQMCSRTAVPCLARRRPGDTGRETVSALPHN